MNAVTLPPALTPEQRTRCLMLVLADACEWGPEAKADNLPDIETMHLDWQIDQDLRDAGVDAYALQRLSFQIAKALA